MGFLAKTYFSNEHCFSTSNKTNHPFKTFILKISMLFISIIEFEKNIEPFCLNFLNLKKGHTFEGFF